MSYRLYDEVVAFLRTPQAAGLKPADRSVLLLVAGRANDKTREAWGRTHDEHGAALDPHDERRWDLAELAGLQPTGLRTALQRLSRAGVELRVAVGKDARGAPVYAYRGTRTTYRLPELVPAREAAATTKADAVASPTTPKGNTVAAPWGRKGDATASQGDATVSPQRSEGSRDKSSSPRPCGALAAFVAEHAATDDEMATLTEKINKEHRPRKPAAYLATMAASGDLAVALTGLRAQAARDRERAELNAWRAWAAEQPDCPDRIPGGNLARPDTGRLLCPTCQLRATHPAPASTAHREPALTLIPGNPDAAGGPTGIWPVAVPDNQPPSTAAVARAAASAAIRAAQERQAARATNRRTRQEAVTA